MSDTAGRQIARLGPLGYVVALSAAASLLALALILSIGLGAAPLDASDVVRALLDPSAVEPTVAQIVRELRLPRALLGALVGASQAIALSRLGARPLPWIVGCALGWTAVVAVATLAWQLLTLVEGIGMSALAGAGVGLLGGGVLGLFTSSPLLEIRRQLAR
jgi:iron complex transport system permease protein